MREVSIGTSASTAAAASSASRRSLVVEEDELMIVIEAREVMGSAEGIGRGSAGVNRELETAADGGLSPWGSAIGSLAVDFDGAVWLIFRPPTASLNNFTHQRLLKIPRPLPFAASAIVNQHLPLQPREQWRKRRERGRRRAALEAESW